MGKKKFIDKKKAATFQLLARDTSDPSYSTGVENDRVFVRVDNNPVSFSGFEEGGEYYSNNSGCIHNPDSVFADAPDDEGNAEEPFGTRSSWHSVRELAPLPDHVRREILELGFPDDGYNYLIHLREIKNSGGGSVYYQNPKAKLDELPLDVKAYDASRVWISEGNADMNDKTMYNVVEKTVNLRVQKAVDPDIVALLDDNNSPFGSDVEDLEEDFVIQANLPEDGTDVVVDKSLNPAGEPKGMMSASYSLGLDGKPAEAGSHSNGEESSADGMLRVRRLLDEQFDLLELQEYGMDNDNDYGHEVGEKDESLAAKLSNVFKDHDINDIHLNDNYKAPAELLHVDEKQKDGELLNAAADLLRRCTEYAAKYENDDEDDQEVIIMEESSDESEAWDCETIVSTYSNLDNHPGRIGVPELTRKKKLIDTVTGTLKKDGKNVISLRGKERLPVDYFARQKGY
ncbi:hypothetical protein Ancab_012859 [Ancistrocladus abbreviatus]